MRILIIILHIFFTLCLGCSDEVSGTPDGNSVPPIDGEDDIPPYWKQVKLQEKPGRRYFHTMAYDEERKVTVLFGGAFPGASYPLNDTWEYNGKWHKISTQHSPTKRWKPAMAYDPIRERIVLFGGENDEGGSITVYNDTWEYNGEDWVQINTPHRPERRGSHVMTYDENLHAVLMLGGNNHSYSNPYPQTIWKYDGTDWIKVSDSGPLGVGEGGGMVFDENRKVTILYGGHAGVTSFPDTWEFDGETWTKIETDNNPGGLSFFGMAYDCDKNKTVIFGGTIGLGGYTDKTWEYDGSDWMEIFTSMKPHERNAFNMTYDRYRKRVIMFGGIQTFIQTIYNDTWIYVGENETDAPATINWTIAVLIGALSVIILMSLRYSTFKKKRAYRKPAEVRV